MDYVKKLWPDVTHRLQVAVNDILAVEKSKAMHEGIGELANQIETEALVAVLLD